jgi:hypothetical protein
MLFSNKCREIIAMSTQSDYYTALYCQDFPKRRQRDLE